MRIYLVEEFDVEVQRGEDGKPEWVSGGIPRANWEQFPLFVVRERYTGLRKAGRRFANSRNGLEWGKVQRPAWRAIWVCPVKQWPQGRRGRGAGDDAATTRLHSLTRRGGRFVGRALDVPSISVYT